MPAYTPLTDEHLAFLRSCLSPDRVSTSAADRDLHARDQSFHAVRPPDVIVWPETTEEVSNVLRYANRQRIPVTPWGAGSSLEGNPIAVNGGIMLDFARMNRIVSVRAEDFQVDVQPGITRIELNKALARYGLFFTPEPGADATIGGMIANNAAGVKTIKYGATKDNVLRLEVVQASGAIIRVGTRARKDSSGYDLLHLFVGSEGTLGVITEATLKLAPIPADFSAVLAAFESVEQAIQSVVDIVGAGLEPSALEFVDKETVEALNRDKSMSFVVAPTVIMEFIGASDTEGLQMALEICKENGATNFAAAVGREERNKLWEVRHHTYESLVRLHPGFAQKIMDVAVPISRYPEIVLFADEVLAQHNLLGYKFGHAGDGNLHINIIHDPTDPEQLDRVERANGIIVERAIALEGTATGEHGVGIGKRRFIIQQHGPALDVMRQIKGLLDPNCILNPGKIFLDADDMTDVSSDRA
ncbi:MAG: FAD-binding protein [Anaerolineae bacterium]|nr:FAD-binding protein [Anaerolineae bacterium]